MTSPSLRAFRPPPGPLSVACPRCLAAAGLPCTSSQAGASPRTLVRMHPERHGAATTGERPSRRGNPADSKWRSTPPELRKRPPITGTVPRELLEAARGKAAKEGLHGDSALLEAALRAWVDGPARICGACGVSAEEHNPPECLESWAKAHAFPAPWGPDVISAWTTACRLSEQQARGKPRTSSVPPRAGTLSSRSGS